MDWQPYIKASWEMVMAAEGKTRVLLDEELESYLVHMMARNFRNSSKMPPEIICLELGRARSAEDYRDIGDYYQRMGQIAYSHAAVASRPFDAFLERVGREFKALSLVLSGVRRLSQA
jgi:hypothetical protein